MLISTFQNPNQKILYALNIVKNSQKQRQLNFEYQLTFYVRDDNLSRLVGLFGDILIYTDF